MERFRASDYRFLAVCLALLAVTTWYSVRNFHRAFPEASIDFRVDRAAAQRLAEATVGDRTAGYRLASSFTFDDDAKTFLEREVGLEQANALMSSRIRVWRWSFRWFRPQQKEEYQVDITPRGELAEYHHEIAEDTARPDASMERARAAAEQYLLASFKRDPNGLDFVEVSEVTRPHRVDRTFTWKERDFNLRDATYRIEVTMLGSEVGSYREYLKVPDQWQRDYERLRSKNQVASTVDSAVMVLMLVGLAVVIVTRVRRHDVPWRTASIVGALGMALSFCSQLNQLPLEEFGYPTTDSYTSFMLRQLLNAVIAALGAGGLLFVLTAGAEPLYRETFGDKVALGNLFSLRGLRTRRFFLGTVLGIALTGIFVAYQTAFYIFAARLGAWSPADVPYSDLLNTKFPWMFVLFGGFLPAVSEEFLFRMFGVPFLRKVTRSLAVAVIAAGFIWGFGHAAYPQQPFYIRGVEVGIGGVALGLVMLRWGILPTLVWHYSVDAMYSAMLLLRSESWYFRLSGAASAGVVVLPAALALIAYWRKGGFEPETGLRNAELALPVEPFAPLADAEEQAPAIVEARKLTPRTRIAALALLAAGLLAIMMPAERFGERPQYRMGAEEARAASDRFLRAQGVDPGRFRAVTVPGTYWGGDDSMAAKYFLERLPVNAASALFERQRPLQHWVTRYFQSLDQEELLVSVHPESARILGFNHELPEDRAGADLGPDAARDLARRFAESQGLDPGGMDLKESGSEKKKARRDYKLVWEARDGDARNVDQARYRVEVGVAGDQVASLRKSWRVPETFTRARQRQNLLSISITALRFGLLALLIVFAVWMLLQKVRHGGVPWRTVLLVAIPAAAIAGVAPLLSTRLLLEQYNTAVPLETYQAMSYLIIAMSVVFGFLTIAGACAFLAAYYPESFAVLRRGARRFSAIDTLCAAAAAVGMALIVARTTTLLAARFHAYAIYSIDTPELLAFTAPALAAVANAVRGTLLNAALLGAVALAASQLRRRRTLFLIVALAGVTQVSTEVRTGGEFLLQYCGGLLAAGCLFVFCSWFARRNLAAYGLVLWLAALREPVAELFSGGNAAFRLQGWLVTAAGAAVAVWALLPTARRREEAGPGTGIAL